MMVRTSRWPAAVPFPEIPGSVVSRALHARLAAGLARHHLAVLAGVGVETIRQLEKHGRSTPTTLSKLAAALHVKPEELEGFPPVDGEGA
jgi:transcriptional regulator with XRE-family HTH domain